MKTIPERILEELIKNQQLFRDIKNNYGYNWRKLWSDQLFETIGNLGKSSEMEYSVATAKRGFDEGEWLFDMVWFYMGKKNDDGLQAIEGIALVLESEISQNNIGGFKTDFDKLMACRSKYKIFVFRNIHLPHPSETLELKLRYAQLAIQTYTENTDIHLIYWEDTTIENEPDFKCIQMSKSENTFFTNKIN